MFSNYLSSIEGISFYPVFTLLLFFFIFAGVIFWVFRLNKSYISKMENLPLENELKIVKLTEIKNEK